MKISVTNHGGHEVHRLGFTFKPSETQEVEVLNHRQLLAIQAVRTLEVVVHEQEPQAAEAKVEVQETEIKAEVAPKPKSKPRNKKPEVKEDQEVLNHVWYASRCNLTNWY